MLVPASEVDAEREIPCLNTITGALAVARYSKQPTV